MRSEQMVAISQKNALAVGETAKGEASRVRERLMVSGLTVA